MFDFSVPAFSPLVTRVTVAIVRSGSGCVLTLTHAGVPGEAVARNRNGWTAMLGTLERELPGVAPQ